MPFYRFEDLGEKKLTPHLSSARGPIIEGEYFYFCMVSKDPGTGSDLHYHPNDLMIFPVAGKIHALVGKDRRIVHPGTFIHIPPYARHQMLATEDGQMDYLYVKDRTWTVVGIAEDETVPDSAPSVEEVNNYLRNLSLDSPLQGQIDYVSSPAVVSSDFVGNEKTAIIDSEATIVQGRRCVLYVWYDNEFGYSAQVVRIVQHVAGLELPSYPK